MKLDDEWSAELDNGEVIISNAVSKIQIREESILKLADYIRSKRNGNL
jgi:hypothetical protein